MKFEAIVTDLGGVLFEDGTKNAIAQLSEKYQIDINILKDIYYGELSWRLRTGRISSIFFWQHIYKKYPFLSQFDLKRIWYDAFVLNHDIYQLFSHLSKKIVLGILSGNIHDRVEYLEHKYPFSHLFKFKLYSHHLGMHKLEKGIYKITEAALHAYNIEPQATLFIDDHEDCLEVAEQFGFKTLQYLPTTNLRQELKKYQITDTEDEATCDELKLYEFQHWNLYLHKNQCYLGRMYIVLKREGVIDFTLLQPTEFEEYFGIMQLLKKTIDALFQPDLINYASLGNTYRQLHIHFIPRYKKVVEFNGILFQDQRWGDHYSPYDKNFFLDKATLHLIKTSIAQQLDLLLKAVKTC